MKGAEVIFGERYGLVLHWHCLHCSSILYIGMVWLVYIVRVSLVYILWLFTLFEYIVSFKRNFLVVFSYFYCKYSRSSLIFNLPVICFIYGRHWEASKRRWKKLLNHHYHQTGSLLNSLTAHCRQVIPPSPKKPDFRSFDHICTVSIAFAQFRHRIWQAPPW